MPRLRYLTADVFTDRLFGGNQLAVIPDARSLDSPQMAAIAREFNFSETTFVLPPDDPAHTRRVRIFTPGGELGFAGHPTIGTAHVLAATGEIPLDGELTRIVFEEGVGPVPVSITASGGRPTFCQLSVAQLPDSVPAPADRRTIAHMLSLEETDLADVLQSESVSCGTPFLFVPLRDTDAVSRSRVRPEQFEGALRGYRTQMVMVFAIDANAPGSIRARMFAPSIGVPEDPATGSAAVGLGGYLAARDARRDGTLVWRIDQGVEMGRPSELHVEVDKRGGDVVAVRVGGRSVMVCEGTMLVG
jgi:trans-2,3-dihydro-3-hydroxyanthranilate isomerase